MADKEKVLFLCTGNSARSQMAEAFLNAIGGNRFEAFSAGLEPSVINPLTVTVMAEKGFDLSRNRSKGVDEFLNKVFIHHLITVCSHAEENCPRIWPGLVSHSHWDLDDPAKAEGNDEARLSVFRRVRDEVEGLVRTWVETHAST